MSPLQIFHSAGFYYVPGGKVNFMIFHLKLYYLYNSLNQHLEKTLINTPGLFTSIN
jgi:hypothetical protein